MTEHVSIPGQPAPKGYRPRIWSELSRPPLAPFVEKRPETPTIDTPEWWVDFCTVRYDNELRSFLSPWGLPARDLFFTIAKETPWEHPDYPTAYATFRAYLNHFKQGKGPTGANHPSWSHGAHRRMVERAEHRIRSGTLFRPESRWGTAWARQASGLCKDNQLVTMLVEVEPRPFKSDFHRTARMRMDLAPGTITNLEGFTRFFHTASYGWRVLQSRWRELFGFEANKGLGEVGERCATI